MTLIRPQMTLMDTDYFEQRIKTDDTDTTTDDTDGHGFLNNGLRRMTLRRPQIALMDTDF